MPLRFFKSSFICIFLVVVAILSTVSVVFSADHFSKKWFTINGFGSIAVTTSE